MRLVVNTTKNSAKKLRPLPQAQPPLHPPEKKAKPKTPASRKSAKNMDTTLNGDDEEVLEETPTKSKKRKRTATIKKEIELSDGGSAESGSVYGSAGPNFKAESTKTEEHQDDYDYDPNFVF